MNARASFTPLEVSRHRRLPFSLENGLLTGFTLIELLVVIAIVTILAVVVVLVLNPAELLRQARDSNRLSDIDTLNKAIAFFQVDVSSGSLGNSFTTYFSLVDPTATSTAGTNCQGIPLTPPSGWTYRCAASSTQRKVDGTGWVPVDFTQMSSGAPLSALPIDPVNTSSSGQYYTYTSGGSWAFSTLLESQRYLKQAALDDGGYDPGRYEKGDNLSLQAKAEGLVGWWPFDEGSGTTAGDSSGNGNNGTLTNGPTWVDGKVRKALSFDGINDYVNVPSQSILDVTAGENLTLEAWVRVNGDGDSAVIARLPGPYYRLTVGADPVSNFGTFSIRDTGSIEHWLLGTTTVTDNSWHHLVGVRDVARDRIFIFVDGVQENSQTDSTTSNLATSGVLQIGMENTIQHPLTGLIDEVRIYKRALSAAEIKAIYDATK